jgi:purine nucleosidase
MQSCTPPGGVAVDLAAAYNLPILKLSPGRSAAVARKVIIDCDPGIDDAVALTLALASPRLDVVAVTATAGNVPADQANLNLEAIVQLLDPPRRPRIGAATHDVRTPAIDGCNIHGPDGLGGASLPVSQRHNQHPAEKVICDAVHAAPGQVTIVCLGPLTNLARALQYDPELPTKVGQIIIMGGSVSGIGNITPAAEFNMYFNPEAAQQVFRSPTTKTLIPLEVTSQVVFSLDFLEELPSELTRAGALLGKIVPYAFRTYRQELGLEGIHLHDAVALVAAIHPELFETKEMAGDVETRGELTTGATVFDRRPMVRWRTTLEVATEVDAVAVRDTIIRGVAEAGRQT